MTQYPGRCPHGLNSVACLKCFHAPKAAAQPAQRPPQGPGGIPVANLPARQDGAMATAGDRQGSNIGVPGVGITVDPEERAKYRKEPKGLPVQADPQARAPVPTAYTSEGQGESYDKEGVWQPPKRGELIDRLPRHPESGRMR